MSKLLIQEPPLQVLPTLACAIGLEEAIALQQLHYWLNNPKSDGRVDENGEKWVYNTYAEWKKNDFPFWSEDKIQRTFLNLEKFGLVISRQLDAHKRDMRKFYRIDYDALCAMDDSFLRPSNAAKVNDVKDELTETTTENISLDVPKMMKDANRTVDGLLETQRQAIGKINYPKRESLPEAIRDLIDEFVRASGIKPISKDMLNWLQAGNDWLEIGAQVKDIEPAYKIAKEKYQVYSPHSITKELQRYKAQAHKTDEPKEDEWL